MKSSEPDVMLDRSPVSFTAHCDTSGKIYHIVASVQEGHIEKIHATMSYVYTFAYIKIIECNNVLFSSIGFACSSGNFVKRYDLVALSKIHVCNKVVTMTLLH